MKPYDMLRLFRALGMGAEEEENEFFQSYREEERRESESLKACRGEEKGSVPLSQWAKVSAIRRSGELKKWAKAVKERDGYICQKCFKNKRVMYAHHKLSLLGRLDKAFSLGNGITLCLFCHMKEDPSFEKRMLSNLYKTSEEGFDTDVLQYIEERKTPLAAF